MKELNIEIDPTVKPIFADEIIVAVNIKQEKKKGKLTKEGHLSLIFLDMFTKRAVSRIVISSNTAKALDNVLKINIERLEKELKSKTELKQPVKVETTSTEKYIG